MKNAFRNYRHKHGLTQNELADKFRLSQTMIALIESNQRGVPAARCIAIETATDGELNRYDLRPDVFGPAPQKQAA